MQRWLGCFIIIGIIALHVPVSSAITPWEDYVKLKKNYYLFDDQKVERVTCHIEVSTLDPKKMIEPLKPIEKNIKIKENISDFSVTYSRNNGITFTVPHFEVFIVSPDTAEDLKQLEATVKNFNQNADGAIQGLVQAIDGILDEFMLPKKESISDLEISHNGIETTVKYKRRGASGVDVYSGNQTKSHASMPGLDLDATDEFESINGKLILSESSTQMRQGETNMDGRLIVQHTDFGKIIFPTLFKQKMHISNPNFNVDMDFAIILDKCTIE